MFRWSRLRAGEVIFALVAICAIVGLGLFAASWKGPGPQTMVKAASPANSLLAKLSSGVPPVFGQNVRANSDSTSFGQHEPSLAVSRVHTNTVVVASKDYRDSDNKHVWIESSTDGGATWPLNRQLQMPGLDPTAYPLQSDPVVMARDDGRIYVACLGYNNSNAVFITWTDDDGATWHNPSVQISPTDGSLDDKDWFAIDNTPSSPYYHRMYMMYAPGASIVDEQHSTDGGLTWTPRQDIGTSGTEYTYPVVGSDGTVYNFMMLGWGAGQTGTVQLTKSTNGGASWSTPTTVATAEQPNSPIRGVDQFRFFAIISAAVDPISGNLYAAWTDNRNFNTDGTDVLYVKSTDHGATWTSPDSPSARLSHDPTGVVHDHITPMLTVGNDGKLQAFWLDTRLDSRSCATVNCFFDSWYTSSTDGGATWDPDTRVSTVSQDLNVGLPPGSGGAAGDYWGLDTAHDAVYVAWNDTRGGDQDIYVARGLFGGGGGTPTPTPIPSSTATPSPVPSNTPIASATNTPLTPLPTSTRTHTPTNTPTTNPAVTATLTALPIATQTAATETATPSGGTPTATPAPCAIQFSDVQPGSTFYIYVHTLACRGIISGYPDNTFRPDNNVTRGQLSKIVSNSAGFNDQQNSQMFQDVPVGSTFQVYIGRLASRGFINGYACGGAGEPCVPPGNLHYFRPNANATRGQISKIVSNAAGFNDTPSGQQFQDVPAGSTYYAYIYRLVTRSVMSGYPCGAAPAGQCVPPGNLPYFLPNNNATRGQTSKIVSNAFFP